MKQWFNGETLLLKDLEPSLREAEAGERAQKDWGDEKSAQRENQELENAVSTDQSEEEVEDATHFRKPKPL